MPCHRTAGVDRHRTRVRAGFVHPESVHPAPIGTEPTGTEPA